MSAKFCQTVHEVLCFRFGLPVELRHLVVSYAHRTVSNIKSFVLELIIKIPTEKEQLLLQYGYVISDFLKNIQLIQRIREC